MPAPLASPSDLMLHIRERLCEQLCAWADSWGWEPGDVYDIDERVWIIHRVPAVRAALAGAGLELSPANLEWAAGVILEHTGDPWPDEGDCEWDEDYEDDDEEGGQV